MYSFIYYYFYKFAVKKRNPSPKFIGAGMIFFALVVHVCFPLAIIKKVFGVYFGGVSDSYLINKLYMMPFAFAILYAIHFYYLRRFDKIEDKYCGDEMLTRKNTIIVLSIIFVPLIVMIQLLKK